MAEAAMLEMQPDGARDELGFGLIHFAYADKFFPGTSVLHTSVRYSLFVCWAYRELLLKHPGAQFSAADLADIEDRTGHKLMLKYGRQDGHGILGGRVLRRGQSPVTRPSRIYWNALKTWGLVSRDARTNKPPNQSDVHRNWQDYSVNVKGPEVDATIGTQASLLDDVPPAPNGWTDGNQPLDFSLDKVERTRILRAWNSTGDAPSLMARLAHPGRSVPLHLYQDSVLDLCDASERLSLHRARQAASLVCIGRALYSAMVLDMKADTSEPHSRRLLDDALNGHQKAALQLDISKLGDDVSNLGDLRTFLSLIQEWVAKPGDYSHLLERFRSREYDLKNDRALLLAKSSARRELWTPGIPQPLTYRWYNVVHFLKELAA